MSKNNQCNKKHSIIKLQGIVLKSMGRNNFAVQICNTEHVIQAYVCGKMYKNTIQVLPGDKVDIEMNKYDLSKGIIKFRR